jgi:hypothetical protein
MNSKFNHKFDKQNINTFVLCLNLFKTTGIKILKIIYFTKLKFRCLQSCKFEIEIHKKNFDLKRFENALQKVDLAKIKISF